MFEAVVPAVETFIHSTSGPLGLLVALVYSFLVAIALPFPGELVLVMRLDLGVHPHVEFGLLVAVSSLGKALGSVLALRVGNGATRNGPFARLARRWPRVSALRERTVSATVGQYGYLGLAVALAVPLMPDTALIYGFSVVETNYLKFALAAFVGTAARLVLVAALVGGALALT